MNKVIVNNKDDIERLTQGFLFYDGFFEEINISYANSSLYLLVRCRDLDEKWLNMAIYLEKIDKMVFFVKKFNGYPIVDTLRIIPNKKDEYLLTFDDEDMTDIDDLLKNGNFSFVGKELSYTTELL